MASERSSRAMTTQSVVLSPLLGRRTPQPKAPNIGKEHPLVLDLAAINYKKENAAKSGPVDIFSLIG